MEALLGLGPVEALRILVSYLRARAFPIEDERSFEDWVVNRFGRRLFEIFFQTYTEKVWGRPCSEIGAEWAAQRIKNLDLVAAVRNALLGGRGDGELVTTLIDRFHYPRLGPGMMWERWTERLAGRGIEVRLGAEVTRLEHDGRRVVAAGTRTADGATGRVDGDHFISTMPIRELVHAMDPPPPPEVVAAADSAAVPRLPDGRPHRRRRRAVPRQLDLHPFPRRAGRTDPELQELESRDGARRFDDLSGARVLRPRGRRPVVDAGRGADRARRARDRAARAGGGGARPGRRGGAGAEGVSGVRRRVPRGPGHDPELDLDPRQPPARRAQRTAPVQQPGPLDADRHPGRQERGRRAPRHLVGERRGGVPRGNADRRAADAGRDPRADARGGAAPRPSPGTTRWRWGPRRGW